MMANNRAYGKWKRNLLKHRIISFHRWDCILPDEAFNLAAYVSQAYGERYITAYGVHVDTNNVHIHLAIDTISWKDGSRFDISFELKWLRSMISSWEKKREEFLTNELDGFQRHWEYYGD